MFLASSLNAQQDPQWSMYMFDRMSFNPGAVGVNGSWCGTFMGRNQWTGFGDEPRTFLMNANGPIRVPVKGGIGISIYNDHLGNLTNNVFRGAYSYHTSLGGPGLLGIGIGAGYMRSSFRDNWTYIDNNDGKIDDLRTGGNASDGGLDFSLGLYYMTLSWYVGVSSTRLSESNFEDINIETARHYYFMAGYKFNRQNWSFRPSTLIKSDLVSTQYDFNFTIFYDSRVWGGVSYRVGDAIAPMVGIQQNFQGEGFRGGTLKVGYAYDYTTSNIWNYSHGSHEIVLNYCFNPSPEAPMTRSVNPMLLE